MKQLYKTILEITNCNSFSNKELNENCLQSILSAALSAKYGNVLQTTEFIVIDDKTDLKKLSDADLPETNIILHSSFVVVAVQSDKNACFKECAAVSVFAMLAQAEELNAGCFFYNPQNKMLTDGTLVQDIIRGILNISDDKTIFGVLAFGEKEKQTNARSEDEIEWERVHINTYNSEKQ